MSEGSISECEAHEFARRATLLSRLSLLFASVIDPSKARSLMLAHLRQEFQADAATLFLLEPSHQDLKVWAIEGGASSLSCERIPVDRSLVGWVVRNQASVLSNDVQNDSRLFVEADKHSHYRTESMLCVPLTGPANAQVGAIQLLNRPGGFTQADLELLECASALVVLGVQNAVLRERTADQRRRLEALKKRRDDMVTILSHEFRTPLGIIQATASLIAGGTLSPDLLQRSLQGLTENVFRLTRLVSELRNASATAPRALAKNKDPMSVSSVCEEVVEHLFRATSAVRNLKMVAEIAPDLRAIGDETLLAIALTNILHNAVRFTPDGGGVNLRAERRLGSVVIEIQDSGIGIPEDQRGAIFEKFYEIGSTLSHSSGSLEFGSGGLGLGLPTAQNVLEALGGSLEVSSREGEGSTFRIVLKERAPSDG